MQTPVGKYFQAAGFKRGFLAAIGPQSIKRGFEMYREGNQQGTYKKGNGGSLATRWSVSGKTNRRNRL